MFAPESVQAQRHKVRACMRQDDAHANARTHAHARTCTCTQACTRSHAHRVAQKFLLQSCTFQCHQSWNHPPALPTAFSISSAVACAGGARAALALPCPHRGGPDAPDPAFHSERGDQHGEKPAEPFLTASDVASDTAIVASRRDASQHGHLQVRELCELYSTPPLSQATGNHV
eukprot:6186062-Pleurochrysis_carterae.AAC.1